MDYSDADLIIDSSTRVVYLHGRQYQIIPLKIRWIA